MPLNLACRLNQITSLRTETLLGVALNQLKKPIDRHHLQVEAPRKSAFAGGIALQRRTRGFNDDSGSLIPAIVPAARRGSECRFPGAIQGCRIVTCVELESLLSDWSSFSRRWSDSSRLSGRGRSGWSERSQSLRNCPWPHWSAR